MKGLSNCLYCKKQFHWQQAKIPLYCSRSCHAKDSQKRKCFSWEKLTYEQKIDRLRKSFENKVIKKDGCWDWKGGEKHTNVGYLKIRFDGPKILAHRASWMIYKGEIPKNICICHTCDNRRCTNPDHLFLGTHKDNARDRDEKGKGSQGEKNGFSKLNEKKVSDIKKLISLNVDDTYIAKKFHVSAGCIWFIRKGIRWKHVFLNPTYKGSSELEIAKD